MGMKRTQVQSDFLMIYELQMSFVKALRYPNFEMHGFF